MIQRILSHITIFFLIGILVSQQAFAQTPYPNPLQGADTIPGFLALVLQGLSLLLLPLIVLFIIYAGYLFVTAQGEESRVQKAKTALLYTIIGAGVILGAQIMADILSETLTELNTP